MRSKPFSHPAIIAVLRESFFTNIRGGSFASKNEDRFKSSLHAKHPIELEIPSAMLALAATSVCHFFSDIYADVIYYSIGPLSSWWLPQWICQEDGIQCRHVRRYIPQPHDISFAHSGGKHRQVPPLDGRSIFQSVVSSLITYSCGLYLMCCSTVSLPHTAIVTNDAIAQLDLNGMDE